MTVSSSRIRTLAMPDRARIDRRPRSRVLANSSRSAWTSAWARRYAGTLTRASTARITDPASAGSVTATSPTAQWRISCLRGEPAKQLFGPRFEVDIIRDDDEDRAALDVGGDVIEQRGDVGRFAVGVDAVVDRAQHALEVQIAAHRRQVGDAPRPVARPPAEIDVGRHRPGDEADRVAVAHRDLPDGTGGQHRDIALVAARCGERRHRPTRVDHEQHGMAARCDVPLHQRSPDAGGRLPVDVLDVVADRVLAQVVEVHAPAAVDRAVLALDQVGRRFAGPDREPRLDLAEEGLPTHDRPLRGRDGGEDGVDDRLDGNVVGDGLEPEPDAVPEHARSAAS